MNAGRCPDKQTLFGYMMGTISEGEAEIVDRHLASCQECERTAEALEGLSDTMITALRQPAGGDAFAEAPECGQVLQKLRKLPIGNPGAGSRPPTVPPTKKPRRVTRLGDYDLLKKLGQGGMGTVYKARHTRLKRVVALKVLPKNRLEDEVAVARFEREMEAVGRLDHPNIVRAMDAREVDRIRFLVMEYVDGLDLSEVVDRCGPLSIADASETIRQAALGLECSRENGLVHRDVKPSNLMLTTDGQVKVLDLGLAQIQEAEALGEEVTGVGQVMGTPDYISPEQALESHTVDIRTDVYSLGCTLYCLLVGHPPFTGPDYDTPMKKVTGHIRDTVPPIGVLKPDVPKPIARLLERMLEKDPKQRVASPSEVVGVLAPFCKGSKLIGLLRQARSLDEQDEPGKSRIETGELQASAMIDTSRDDLGPGEEERDSSAAAPLDPYHRWLGIPPAAQPANHYRLLGLAVFEDDPEVIRDAAARQMAHVRTYHLGQHLELSQKILNELGAAKACLLNPRKKAAYDAGLRTDQHPEPMDERKPAEPPPVSAEFLVSVEKQAPRIRIERPRFNRPRFNGKKPPALVWIAAGAAALFVFLSVVLYVTTGKGSIKIVLNDPEADVEVRINGDVIEIAGLEDPIRLRPGQHELLVTSDNFETYTKSFKVKRGGNPVLEVTLVPLKSAGVAASSRRWGLDDPLVEEWGPLKSAGVAASSRPRVDIAESGQTPVPASIGPKTSGSEPPLAVAPFDTGGAKQHQQAWADYQGLPVEQTNSIGMKFVLIPSGEFMMGSPEDDPDKEPNETPQHRVRITRPFYLGVHEVTQAQYEKVMGENPARFEGPALPVIMVSWNDATAFCAKLSKTDARFDYRLPTEAEWEYACRAGTTTRYSCGDELDPQYAWFGGAGGNGDEKTHPVGQKRPNGWGLYDMHGNVWEWCQDWWDAGYYANLPSDDPAGPPRGSFRVLRGGGWVGLPGYCRSASRGRSAPGNRYDFLGFRVAQVRAE